MAQGSRIKPTMAGFAPSHKKQFATDLGARWSGFLMAVLDPGTILLLITTLAFVYGATVQNNKPLTAMFSALAAVCSSIFGGLVTNRWQESAQTEVLVARGKSAIRNLKLLLSSVGGLERRVNCYLDWVSGSDCRAGSGHGSSARGLGEMQHSPRRNDQRDRELDGHHYRS